MTTPESPSELESPGSPNILDPGSPDPEDPEPPAPSDNDNASAGNEASQPLSLASDSNAEESNESQNRKYGVGGDEPPAKVRKIDSDASIDISGAATCPICLGEWDDQGEHRLVALKCGHLFGYKCVEQWLQSQTSKNQSCPTCKSRVFIRDIRPIYGKCIVTVDKSEIVALQKKLDTVQKEKSRLELELLKSSVAHAECLQRLQNLRTQLYAQPNLLFNKQRSTLKSWRFSLEKNLEVCKEGGCRVLAYNCRTYNFYASQKSIDNPFPGYGIRQINLIDNRTNIFMHLHAKAIRDMAYSQPKDLLLSVSLDSTAKIVERGILATTIQAGAPLWSCTWDSGIPNVFYVGGVGGNIRRYDIRHVQHAMSNLQAPGDISPVVSLCSTEYGLLSCHLNSSWLWVNDNFGHFQPKPLPVVGPFMSMCYDPETCRVLLSCRANESERSRLSLCQLNLGEDLYVTCNLQHTFSGSAKTSLMSRVGWVRAPGASWIAAHSESESALILHGLDGETSLTLKTADPALDVCSMQVNGDTILATLTNSRLRVYKGVHIEAQLM